MKIKVLFVCLGNICRSPMAEFVFKDMVHKQGLSEYFEIASAGTSAEETGNPVHPGTRKILSKFGISTEGKLAVKMAAGDYLNYDYILAMEQRNVSNILRIIGQDTEHKVCRLLDYSNHPRDIADPWYTGEFDQTYHDVFEGCEALLRNICQEHHLNYHTSC
jgi:protein-tyrosine phosphatase